MRAAHEDDWLGLSGKVCVVTGAAEPVAREIAVRLAAAGASLLLLDPDGHGCGETAAACVGDASPVLAVACDPTDPDSIAEAARDGATLGPVDVLVTVAGTRRPGPIETLALTSWNAPLAFDLTGCLLVVQEFGRPMLERGRGTLVHVAADAASHPQAFAGSAGAAASGLAAFSRQIAVEWGPRGVRSNVISPGLLRAPLTGGYDAVPDGAERRDAPVPLRRIGTPADIADVALFLASDRAAYVTGQEVAVDGGLSRTLMNYVPRSDGTGRSGPTTLP